MSKDSEQEIVDRLIKALALDREEKSLSKYRVAQITGLSKSSIGRIESGQQNPTLYSLLKIAHAQGIKISDLLKDLE